MKLFDIIVSADGFAGTIWPGCKGITMLGSDFTGTITTGSD